MSMLAFVWLCVSPGATGRAWATAPAEDDAVDVALVGIEIKQESGVIVRTKEREIAWREPTKLVIDFDGRQHEVALDLRRASSKSKNIVVELAYAREGQPMIAPKTVRVALGRRVLVHEGDDGIAIALTLGSKWAARPRRPETLPPQAGDEPLSGLEE